ncbi:Uncharacterised protein [Shigella sonnei]|nr:Uncharacterised protein [Shigella sonnei]
MGQHNVVIGSQHFQHHIGHGFHRLRLMRYAYQAYNSRAIRRPDKAFTPHPA